MERMTWEQICQSGDYSGRWVALDCCSYDQATGRAAEGAVVDADIDLVELCARLQAGAWKNCAILFCEETIERDMRAAS